MRHDEACDTQGGMCVYWCEVGGLVRPLRNCVAQFDRMTFSKDHPARPVIAEAKMALRRWER